MGHEDVELRDNFRQALYEAETKNQSNLDNAVLKVSFGVGGGVIAVLNIGSVSLTASAYALYAASAFGAATSIFAVLYSYRFGAKLQRSTRSALDDHPGFSIDQVLNKPEITGSTKHLQRILALSNSIAFIAAATCLVLFTLATMVRIYPTQIRSAEMQMSSSPNSNSTKGNGNPPAPSPRPSPPPSTPPPTTTPPSRPKTHK